jgi:hypothetical protein
MIAYYNLSFYAMNVVWQCVETKHWTGEREFIFLLSIEVK